MKNVQVNAGLAARLLEITTENTVKRQTVMSINDLLVEVLFKRQARLTRTEIVNEVSILRFENNNSMKITAEFFENPILIEEFIKITKTVKNGVDTSLSNSNNNSSFSFNENYSMYQIIEHHDKTYSIILKDVVAK